MDNKPTAAPLYRDPIYDGASDPVVIWNRGESQWWMLYTQRRATDMTVGFSSIHGSRIGVASSRDGSEWLYRGTLPGLDFEPGHNTFWAPEVIFEGGKYHMYVSYITGVPTHWNYPRDIVHYTADNMWDWKFESVLPLSSGRVIDACIYQTSPGLYKMWYKDEAADSRTYTAVSSDLYGWETAGAEITDCAHEGPNVFELGGVKWMITDCWDGLAIYRSDDFTVWESAGENLLKKPGVREGDGTPGHHADVVVLGGRAYIFYFTHAQNGQTTFIQAAELKTDGKTLTCDRDAELPRGFLGH